MIQMAGESGVTTNHVLMTGDEVKTLIRILNDDSGVKSEDRIRVIRTHEPNVERRGVNLDSPRIQRGDLDLSGGGIAEFSGHVARTRRVHNPPGQESELEGAHIHEEVVVGGTGGNKQMSGVVHQGGTHGHRFGQQRTRIRNSMVINLGYIDRNSVVSADMFRIHYKIFEYFFVFGIQY